MDRRPPALPRDGNKQQAGEDLIRKHFEEDLSPEDRAVLVQASKKFMAHSVVGLWAGSLVGCSLAFRHRWRSSIQAMKFVRSARNQADSGVPKLYYSKESGAAAGAARETTLMLLGKGLGFGLLGGFLGTQIGVFTGSRAAQKILEEHGPTKERLKFTMEAVTRDLKHLMDMEKQDRRSSSTPPSAREADPTDERNYKWSEAAEEGPTPAAAAAAADTTEAPASRWEELRKSRLVPPSSWDKLREASAKSNLPRSAAAAKDGNAETDPSPSSFIDEDTARAEKARRKKEFDDLLERERAGGNDGSSKTWR